MNPSPFALSIALVFANATALTWAAPSDPLVRAPQGDPKDGGAASEEAPKSDRVVEMPSDERIEPPAADSKFDAVATLRAAVDKLGYETFERAVSVEFVRRSYQWRAGAQSMYDSRRTYANLRFPLVGKVQELSNYEGNRYVYYASIVNRDDAFELRGAEVLSQPAHENNARQYLVHELMLAFLPFYVELTQAPLEYAGIATLDTFEPRTYDEEKGWIDYAPVTRTYDLVRAAMPQPYSAVTGETVDLYFDRTSGAIRLLGARDLFQGITGANRLLYEVVATQDVGGITLPKDVRIQVDGSGYCIQTLEFSGFAIHDQPVPAVLLKRP